MSRILDFYLKTIKSGFFSVNELNNFEVECYDDMKWHTMFLEQCFRHGYDVNGINSEKDNLLIWLFQNYNGPYLLQLTEFLIESGIDVNYSNPTTGMNSLLALVQSYKVFYTERAGKDTVPVMLFLINKGVDINHINAVGENALWEACKLTEMPAREWFRLVDVLLKAKIDVNVWPEGHPASNALVLLLTNRARKTRTYDERRFLQCTVKALLDNGIDLRAKMSDENSVLTLLVEFFVWPPVDAKDTIYILQSVVERGVDLNAVDIYNRNVLNMLCCKNYVDYVTGAFSEFYPFFGLLIKKGIDVNNVDSRGNNALLNFVIHCKKISPQVTLPLMKLLLKADIDCNQKDEYGKNVWDLMCSRADVTSSMLLRIAELFLAAGADVPLDALRTRLSENEIDTWLSRGCDNVLARISAGEMDDRESFNLELSEDEMIEADDKVFESGVISETLTRQQWMLTY